MEASRGHTGRKVTKIVSPDLIKFLKKKDLFPAFLGKNPLNEPSPSAGDLNIIIDYMSHQIRDYLTTHRSDTDIIPILKPLFHDEESLESFKKGQSQISLLNAKTLKRVFETDKKKQEFKASAETIAVMKVFRYVITLTKKQLEKIKPHAGLYYEMGIHSTLSEKFQLSLLWIKEDGTAILKYHSLRLKKVVEEHFDAQLTDSGLALLLVNDSVELAQVFYLFLGDNTEETDNPYIQAPQIYTAVDSAISSLCIFRKADVFENESISLLQTYYDSFIPSHSLSGLDKAPNWAEENQKRHSIDKAMFEKLNQPLNENEPDSITIFDNIHYFLLNKSYLRTAWRKNGRFNFEKEMAIEPSPFVRKKALYYSNAKRFSGEYRLYFNERYPSLDFPEEANDYSTIGQGNLSILSDSVNGQFTCKLEVKRKFGQKNHSLMVFKGYVLNDELNSDRFIILSMYLEKSKDRYFKIVLKDNAENPAIFYGTFLLTYYKTGELGAGVCVAEKAGGVSSEGKEEYTTLLPTHPPNSNRYINQIRNFLFKQSNASLAPPKGEELLRYDDLICKGSYLLYQINEESVKISILTIFGSGYTFCNRFITTDSDGTFKEYGDSRLYSYDTFKKTLVVKLNSPQENKAPTHYSFDIDSYPIVPKRSLYKGICSGVTLQGKPFAAIVFIECLSNDPNSEALNRLDNVSEVSFEIFLGNKSQYHKDVILHVQSL